MPLRGPTILGLNHDNYDSDSRRKNYLKLLVNRIETGGRIFIEGTWSGFNDVKKKNKVFDWKREVDPFLIIYDEAQKRDIQVIFLDRRLGLLMPKYDKWSHFKSGTPTLLERHIMHNLREKDWARKVQSNNASTKDLIIMHPNHVRGFTIEAKDLHPVVLWIDKPIINKIKERAFRRLSSKERRKLSRERAKKRAIRKTK